LPKAFPSTMGSWRGIHRISPDRQEGTNDAGKLAEGGIGPETRPHWKTLRKWSKLRASNSKTPFRVTFYLADIREFPDMNTVYKTFTPDPKPARATIQAAALVNNARIEISASKAKVAHMSRTEIW
jgi:2-iminobutanoate/2-iminopropanoate deaminase